MEVQGACQCGHRLAIVSMLKRDNASAKPFSCEEIHRGVSLMSCLAANNKISLKGAFASPRKVWRDSPLRAVILSVYMISSD